MRRQRSCQVLCFWKVLKDRLNPSLGKHFKGLQIWKIFSDNSTVGVTSTDNLQKRDRRRVSRSAFLICQIGDNEGRFHLLCKDKIAKLLPIKSEKKNCKNTAMDKNHYLTNSLLETKFFPYPSTTEEQMLWLVRIVKQWLDDKSTFLPTSLLCKLKTVLASFPVSSLLIKCLVSFSPNLMLSLHPPHCQSPLPSRCFLTSAQPHPGILFSLHWVMISYMMAAVLMAWIKAVSLLAVREQ